MDSVSRYQIFCKIMETGSFTKTAEKLHYSQSAISQSVLALERDLGVTLLIRSKDGVRLTKDGEQFYPYIRNIAQAEDDCFRKTQEMQGLSRQTVVIGGFSSVGRHILPPALKRFKEHYPTVRFVIKQGDYSDIRRWVQEGEVDLGFIDSRFLQGLPHAELYSEPLMAVMPKGHLMAANETVSMEELAAEPFIIMDEGESSDNSVRPQFEARGLSLCEEYAVYDDYSILAMVRQGLGVSVLYQNILRGIDAGVEVRSIREEPERTIAVVWKEKDTMPLAAARFLDMLTQEK